MSVVFLLALFSAWVLYRSTHQHSQRWRWPGVGVLIGLGSFVLTWLAAARIASAPVGFFIALSALMLALTVVALLGGWRQHRAQP